MTSAGRRKRLVTLSWRRRDFPRGVMVPSRASNGSMTMVVCSITGLFLREKNEQVAGTLQGKPEDLPGACRSMREEKLPDLPLILLVGRVHILQHLRDACGTGKHALDIFEHDILHANRPVLIQEVISTHLERRNHFLSCRIKRGIGDIGEGGVGNLLFQVEA